MKRAIRYIGAGIALLLLGLVGYVELRWDRTFDVPLPEFHASTDPAVIERGRYLANGPAHCAACHTSPAQREQLQAGEVVPMAGGNAFTVPFGTIHFPNITSDPETGIGRLSDAQLARALRHGVRHDGRPLLAMSFQELAEDDLLAIVSFLRTQPPVHHPVPDHEFNFLGRALSAFLLTPTGPTGTPPVMAPTGPTVERGRYLAHDVAACFACHTQHDMTTGQAVGAAFAGGAVLPDDESDAWEFVTPNLTTDAKTGRLARMSEEQFLARLRTQRLYAGSHMPWEHFARMSDDDLRAIYRYLRTIPPAENETGPVHRIKS